GQTASAIQGEDSKAGPITRTKASWGRRLIWGTENWVVLMKQLLWGDDSAIGLRTPVAVKLPGVPHFRDFIQIQVGHDQLILIATALGEDLAARIAKVGLPVELPDGPRLFHAHPVDRADEILIGHRMRRLLELPEIFTESGHGSGGIENNL